MCEEHKIEREAQRSKNPEREARRSDRALPKGAGKIFIIIIVIILWKRISWIQTIFWLLQQKSLAKLPWWKYRTGIQSERIRTIPSHSEIWYQTISSHFEPMWKKFFFSFDENQSKINPTSSDSFRSDWSKPNFKSESIWTNPWSK